MVVFEWTDFTEDCEGHYFLSLREARRTLRIHLAQGYGGEYSHGKSLGPIDICSLEIGRPSVDLVMRLLNGDGFVLERTLVERWEAHGCGRCKFCLDQIPTDCTKKFVARNHDAEE